jgi:hypothetical protein
LLKTARRAAAKPLRWGHPMFHTLAAMQLLLALNQGGVIPRVLSDLFAAADNIQAEHSSTDFHFRVSYLEIYNEEVWRKHVERNVPSAARSNPRWRDSSRRETSSRRKGGGPRSTSGRTSDAQMAGEGSSAWSASEVLSGATGFLFGRSPRGSTKVHV